MAVATAPKTVCVTDQIGETAGVVWHYLNDHGTTSLAKLVKELEPQRDLVMQAVGWLAREDKLALEDEGRTRVVRLRD
jgi:hypothetical protein